MNNSLKKRFIDIMDDENMEYIPEKSIKYKDTFRFSSILNIEDKYEFFLKKEKNIYYTKMYKDY